MQTCLKAVTGAVSSIHIVHHRSLLAAVSYTEPFRYLTCLFITIYEYVQIVHEFLALQIFGMSLWDYGTDVMDALVELLVSLVSTLATCPTFLLLTFLIKGP